MHINLQKQLTAGFVAIFAIGIHMYALYWNEITVITSSRKCGWRDVSTTAGQFWISFGCVSLFTALYALSLIIRSQNAKLWSRLYLASGFLVSIAAICALCGKDSNTCHQQQSQIGFSPLIAIIASAMYFSAGLIQRFKP